jgi:FMNH2-dependent dimethyl sulfone monooxygenase
VQFDQHDDRYARTAEWLEVVNGVWSQEEFSFSGKYYNVANTLLQPKPVSRPRPTIYAGGESNAAKELISSKCDAYVMHGDPPEQIRPKIADLAERREKLGLPPMKFGMAGYIILSDNEEEAQAEMKSITDVQQNAAG